jgi:hypothetical protein
MTLHHRIYPFSSLQADYGEKAMLRVVSPTKHFIFTFSGKGVLDLLGPLQKARIEKL